ncbi:MAG: hypothetical protein M1825_000022 [Sarcosagium campestre]|nr:MAG: hypothetical protein M1825_000022 [Sarcosagium campestre]
MPAIPMPAVSKPAPSQHTPRAFMPPATKNPSVSTPAETSSVASRPIPYMSALGPADKENMVPKTTGIPMPAIPMPAVSRPLASQHTPRAFMPPATKNPSVTTPADTNSVASRPIPHKSALGPADKENMVPKTTGIPMPAIPMPAVSRPLASQHTPRAFMPPAKKNPSVTTPADTNSVASRPISHMSALGPADKENLMPKTSIQDPDFAQIPPPSSHQTTLKKRPLSDLVNPEERPAKHQKHAATSATSAVDLPPPQEMPVFVDDGTKPQFSYATLIGMAILRAPNRRLTLAQIYKWISDSFAYYQIAETGWQNSIRHNLSLNKAFIKQERPKNDPGKGNYWAIEPGMEGQFLKDKQSRRTNATSVLPAKRNVGKPVALAMAPQNESVPELSPNATIGTSAADHSTPKAMHSSPPVGLQEALAEITPLIGDYIAYPNYEDGAEQLATLHDSGYWSSAINASAMAVSPGHGATLNPVVLTDPLDMDSGRAEGAIARNRVRTQECLSGAPRALSPEPPRTPVNQIADDGWHDRWNRGWNRPDHFSSPASHISISSTETPVKQAADAETGPNPPEAGCRSPRWEDYLDLPEEEAYAMHRESIRELVPSPAPLFARLPEDPLSEFIIWDDGATNEYDVRMALF